MKNYWKFKDFFIFEEIEMKILFYCVLYVKCDEKLSNTLTVLSKLKYYLSNYKPPPDK